MTEKHNFKGGARDFTPSEKQRSLLMAAQDASYGGCVRAWCRAAEIHHGSYYRWIEDPNFCKWWRAEAEKFFCLRLPRIHAALFDAATRPRTRKEAQIDVAAAKLVLERYDKGFVPRSRQDHVVTPGVLDLSEMSDDELARACKATAIDDEFRDVGPPVLPEPQKAQPSENVSTSTE